MLATRVACSGASAAVSIRGVRVRLCGLSLQFFDKVLSGLLNLMFDQAMGGHVNDWFSSGGGCECSSIATNELGFGDFEKRFRLANEFGNGAGEIFILSDADAKSAQGQL